jgi:hypothetical protein
MAGGGSTSGVSYDRDTSLSGEIRALVSYVAGLDEGGGDQDVSDGVEVEFELKSLHLHLFSLWPGSTWARSLMKGGCLKRCVLHGGCHR